MRSAGDLRRGLYILAVVSVLTLLCGMAASTDVILIESPGCQKCAAAERVLEKMAPEENLTIVSTDYFSDDGHAIIKKLGAKEVPSVIIGSQVIGYKSYDGDLEKLERLIKEALSKQSRPQDSWNASQNIGNANITNNINNITPNDNRSNQSLNLSGGIFGVDAGLDLSQVSLYTVSAVLGAGLVAGFNPCLLGILVFLAAAVLSSAGRRRDLVMMVVFFSLGIFTMYFLFGLGMQRLLQGEMVAAGFRYVLTAFLVVIGLLHIEDARRLSVGKESLFRTDWSMKYVEAGLSGGRLSSYFLLGALFSLVKAPCVGAVYLAILDLISTQSYLAGSVYLLFYNLGIILPIIILGAFMALGMSPEQVDAFRKDHRAKIRLITGLTLLLLAPLIYWQII
ncbi:MAG: cytochrome C biogenesis protein [Methanotrichaceae archaeon]|nr:cytochrome C biogenesis protein [Methanotrichaceae archaeon]